MDASKPNAGGGFLLLCAGGIIGGLALYGFLQERIMAMPYGEDEYFKDSVFLENENPRRITVSAGVATYPAGTHIDSVDALIRAADVALYRAKESGRDRVVQDQPDSAPHGAESQ